MTSFVGGNVGSWRVLRVDPVIGVPLAWISRLEVTEQEAQPPPGNWVLRGVTAFDRDVPSAERSLLEARQEGLGRQSATSAALIPIRKSAAWWDLPRTERCAAFGRRSCARRPRASDIRSPNASTPRPRRNAGIADPEGRHFSMRACRPLTIQRTNRGTPRADGRPVPS